MSASDTHRAAAVAALAWLSVFPEVAQAFPTYVAKGYTNCATCHYSPTGGGLPNSYGHAVSEAVFPDLVRAGWLERAREALAKNDVTGLDPQGEPAFQWDVGLDARALLLRVPTDVGRGPSWLLVPMLAEVGGVVAYGPALAYASVTPRPVPSTQGGRGVFSREHWVQAKLGDRHSVRLGRMVMPFGLRVPDHTQYTREDFGFGKYDQSYGAEWDLSAETWMVSLGAFAGDLVRARPALQERGFVGSVARNVEGRGSFGLSLLATQSDAFRRPAVGLFTRTRLWGKSYVLGELSGEELLSRTTGRSQWEGAGMVRLGWFATESVDLYGELGGRRVNHAYVLAKNRYLLGAEATLLPWVAFNPSVLFEEDVETGLTMTAMGQVHVTY